MFHTSFATAISTALLLSAAIANAQTKAARATSLTPLEKRASLSLDSVRNSPLELRNLLLKMPKGADLHNHLYGAISSETWIRNAADDHLCIDPAAVQSTRPVFSPADSKQPPSCAEGKVPADGVYKDQNLYDALIDSFSMRGFVPSPGVTAHDHFFRTFTRFGGVSERHLGEWLDEIATRADRQNEQYIELMHTPDFRLEAKAGYEIGWPDDLSAFRNALLARGISEDIAAARAAIDADQAFRSQQEHCGQPNASAACRVEIRYLCQVLRGFPKQQVFAQPFSASNSPPLTGALWASISLRRRRLYINVRLRLADAHGRFSPSALSQSAHQPSREIAPGLVTYEGLCRHIRLAWNKLSPRIGPASTSCTDRPHELLKEMAAKHAW
jgi:adenosine deaminase